MDNNKMQVLIVEDEAAVRRSLGKKIDWKELNIEIMGEAQNGEEAYEMVKAAKPEIILLDMRMPGMGGMKLLEILNDQFPEIKVIILSGHSDFEYMRQALKCGATDYLLKPIIKEDLKNAIMKAVEMINEERKNLNERMYQNIILNESIPLLKTSLLNKLILGINLDTAEILKRLSYLNINLDYPYYALAIIEINNLEAVKSTYMNDSSLVFVTLERILNDSMANVQNTIGFKNSGSENEYIYIFGFNERSAINTKLKTLFEQVVLDLENANRLLINVSISDICEKLIDLPKVYRAASHIWGKKKTSDDSNVLLADDFYRESQINNLIPISEIMQIIDSIEQNDRQGFMRIINDQFQREFSLDEKQLETYQKIAAKIYFCIEKVLENSSLNVNAIFNERIFAYNDLIAKCKQPEDIKYGLLKVVSAVADLIAKNKKIESNKAVLKARDYINAYYFEDLSLEFMAKKFYLNPNYFSDLFKKEVGYNFNKYLNMIRIEKAKELLTNQDMKATNVAELVGFKELGYFCIVFKKHTGMTPTEFKRTDPI